MSSSPERAQSATRVLLAILFFMSFQRLEMLAMPDDPDAAFFALRSGNAMLNLLLWGSPFIPLVTGIFALCLRKIRINLYITMLILLEALSFYMAWLRAQ